MSPKIDRPLSSPSEQVAAAIGAQIRSGHYQPGDKIPSVEAITETWKVARDTARRALRLLAEQGLVEVVPYRGSFVSPRDQWTATPTDPTMPDDAPSGTDPVEEQ